MRYVNFFHAKLGVTTFLSLFILSLVLISVTYAIQRQGIQSSSLVSIEPKIIDLGMVRFGSTKSISFVLSNHSPNHIRVLGKSIPCDCTQVDVFPDKIPGYNQSEVKLNFTPTKNQVGQTYNSKIKVFVDDPMNPIVEMGFICKVE